MRDWSDGVSNYPMAYQINVASLWTGMVSRGATNYFAPRKTIPVQNGCLEQSELIHTVLDIYFLSLNL